MKWIIVFSMVLLFACCKQSENLDKTDKILKPSDTVQTNKATPPEVHISKPFANERFKEVTVQRVDSSTFRIKGRGQVFEARFGWVIEDGHYELANGFEMTAAGAPEWGKFDFTVTISKKDSDTTLTLILFETSAKDGSRQQELPIPLL